MRLYFLRHGHAEDGGFLDDHERQLTQEGIDQMHIAANVIQRLGIQPAHIFSSPRVRAVQTAEIVAAKLGTTVQIREEVNFDFSVRAVMHLIQGVSATADVMFVGHEPTFSQVVGALTGARVAMKKGGLARVDLLNSQNASGILVWLIAPAVFGALDGD